MIPQGVASTLKGHKPALISVKDYQALLHKYFRIPSLILTLTSDVLKSYRYTIMALFNYTRNYKEINFRKNPELYQIGKGEQGVLMVEPYKSEILPHWRFRTPEIAEKSSEKIYQLFCNYKKEEDFVGMDMARKYLQMGYTRARRYANHKSGKKYSQENKSVSSKKVGSVPNCGSERNKKHYIKTKTKKILPQDDDALTNEKAVAASIFYSHYMQVREDEIYKNMKQEHKRLYEGRDS